MANESVKVGDEILITKYDREYVSTVAKVTKVKDGFFYGYFYATYISGDELGTYEGGRLFVSMNLDEYVNLSDMSNSSKSNTAIEITEDSAIIEMISNLAQTVAKQGREIEALRHKTDYSDNLLLDRIEELEEEQSEQGEDIIMLDERTQPEKIADSLADHLKRARR